MAAAHTPSPAAPRLSATERRDQLAHVAARRFHALGYRGVSLADVAAEAGVTGPAVYRHFRNKEALLAAAISSGLDIVEAAVARNSDGPLCEMVDAVAEAGLRRPDMWVLLQRESRFLRPELRAAVRDRFSRVVDGFSHSLRRDRTHLAQDDARLLVTAATAILSLPSTTHTSLSATEYRRELAASALAALRTEVAAGRAEAVPDRRPVVAAPPADRRDQVVEAATTLFFRHGYTGVSLDDIGARVGIAGPSVLHHFPTKSALLVTAFDRASDDLARLQLRRRGATLSDGPEAMVSEYVEYALAHRDLLGVYVSEAMHLPADALDRTTAIVRTELQDWTRALLSVAPSLGEHVARLRARAALSAVNDLVRLGRFATRPGIGGDIRAVAATILVRGTELEARPGRARESEPG